MGAALHFDLWVPNFGIQEYMRHNDETDAVFPHAYVFDNGFLHPGEAPGHGVDIDEALAAKYPYEAAYPPFARLEDGTMSRGKSGGASRPGPALPSPAPVNHPALHPRRSDPARPPPGGHLA